MELQETCKVGYIFLYDTVLLGEICRPAHGAHSMHVKSLNGRSVDGKVSLSYGRGAKKSAPQDHHNL